MPRFSRLVLTILSMIALVAVPLSVAQTPAAQTAPADTPAKPPAKPARARVPRATPPAKTRTQKQAAPAPAATGQTTPAAATRNAPTSGAVAADPRGAVATQGLGTFVFAGWTMTAYGCFRTGTRVLCDFDLAPPRNTRANARMFMQVQLVDDGGKITRPHNAFFQATDGSQLPVAYAATDSPLRLLIEYDNVAATYTSVSLVRARERIQGVPVTPADGSQPAGAVPARTPAVSTK